MTAAQTATLAAPATHGRIRIERSAKRVRALLAGVTVADSVRPTLVWEVPYYPAYYLPVEDVAMSLLRAEDATAHSPSRGEGQLYTVTAGGRTVPAAALRYTESPIDELRDLIRIDWDSMDNWFEEDEEVFVHPRNPYVRVDILASTRRVQVEVDGVVVADSTSPRLLFETGLPTRYYFPKTNIRFDLLHHTDTASHCPYKGTAEYWSVRTSADGPTHEDIAWSYRTTLPESQKIVGLVAFYNEKIDIIVDGVRQDRPHTKFS